MQPTSDMWRAAIPSFLSPINKKTQKVTDSSTTAYVVHGREGSGGGVYYASKYDAIVEATRRELLGSSSQIVDVVIIRGPSRASRDGSCVDGCSRMELDALPADVKLEVISELSKRSQKYDAELARIADGVRARWTAMLCEHGAKKARCAAANAECRRASAGTLTLEKTRDMCDANDLEMQVYSEGVLSRADRELLGEASTMGVTMLDLFDRKLLLPLT